MGRLEAGRGAGCWILDVGCWSEGVWGGSAPSLALGLWSGSALTSVVAASGVVWQTEPKLASRSLWRRCSSRRAVESALQTAFLAVEQDPRLFPPNCPPGPL